MAWGAASSRGRAFGNSAGSADRHSSGGGRNRLDDVDCVILSRGRHFPAGGGDSHEVSQLGLGSLRRLYHATTGHSFMGRLAVVGIVVPRPFDWNFTGPAWMGERDVGVRSAKPLHYESGAAPRGLNGSETCKTNFLTERCLMKVREVMTQYPQCCRLSDMAQTVAQMFRDHDIGAMPVLSNGESRRLEGIITDR